MELWWIRRPPVPRATVRQVLVVAAVFVPLCIAVTIWAARDALDVFDLWPWEHGQATGARVLLRYVFTLAVALLYVLARSAWAWVEAMAVAHADLSAVRERVRAGRWREAGLFLHRHCLLRQEVWGSVTAEARGLDDAIRNRLAPRRRVYVYCVKEPPLLPDTPQAGFAPRVAPATVVRWWTVPMFLILLVTAHNELGALLAGQPWYSLRTINFLVLATLAVMYCYLQITAILGRRHYFRFGPGVAQYLTFGIVGRRAQVQSIDLHSSDVILDLTGPSVVLTTASSKEGGTPRSYHLACRPEVIETCLRAALSTAPAREMPLAQLVD